MEREDRQGRFLFLLISLIGLFTLHALFDQVPMDVIMTLVLLSGLWSVSRRPWTLILGCLMSLPAIAVKWTAHVVPNPTLVVVGLSFAISFVVFNASVIFVALLRAKTVTLDVVVGGICIYLFLAMIWALAYTLVEYLHPGSFLVADGLPPITVDRNSAVSSEMIYFSVTTLTTAGLGDIHPATRMGQTLASLELLVGQLYLAVFIARLVSLYEPRHRAH